MQSKGHVPTAQIAPTSDEYVLDQLSTCEEKLLKLLEELDGKELQEIMKQMEEEEVGAIDWGQFIEASLKSLLTFLGGAFWHCYEEFLDTQFRRW